MIHRKLSAIDSTNSYLKEQMSIQDLPGWTVVSTERQTQGRGQQGNSWFSDRSKNLTFSILIRHERMRARDQFLLNCAVSVGIYKTLMELRVPAVKVKWPNDIMSGSQKLAGILIENSLVRDRISHSVVGVGMNVNQEQFPPDLPQAVSLFQLLGEIHDREEILRVLVGRIQKEYRLIEADRGSHLRSVYTDLLYRLNQWHNYRKPEGKSFSGMITGVTEQGLLILESKDGSSSFYGFKEIQYLN